MTAGPLVGPASAYPTSRSPALIWLKGAKETLAPPLGGVWAEFAATACAFADPRRPSLAAAMPVAAAPKKRRRATFRFSDDLIVSTNKVPCFNRGMRAAQSRRR